MLMSVQTGERKAQEIDPCHGLMGSKKVRSRLLPTLWAELKKLAINVNDKIKTCKPKDFQRQRWTASSMLSQPHLGFIL